MPAWALNVEGRYIAEFIRGVFHSGAIYNGIDRTGGMEESFLF